MTTSLSKIDTELRSGSQFAPCGGYAPFERNPRQSGDVPGSSGSSKAHDRDAAHRLTHVDLFSGIGGFALACRWAGIETIGFSEVEPYACKVLAKHWPGVTNYGDIRSIEEPINCDIITGGFPCQPFSLAGQRRGKEDDRHLWPEMLRVIALCRPAWVLGENVPGIINVALDDVLSDLGRAGYACQTFAVPACGVDARHRRNRIWIVANTERDGRRTDFARRETQGRTTARRNGENVADTDATRRREQCGTEPVGAEQRAAKGGRKNVSYSDDGADNESWSQRDQWALENSYGESNRRGRDWSPEPGVGRVAHGIPNRSHRLKGLGNAIVPQVAFVFLDAIRRVELEARKLAAREHGSSVRGERTNTEHNGAQEHNKRLTRRENNP